MDAVCPYNKEHEFYVEEFERSYESPDVNSVSCIFQNESNSITDWQNFYIPFSETSGFWATSNNYNPHDIVYLAEVIILFTVVGGIIIAEHHLAHQ